MSNKLEIVVSGYESELEEFKNSGDLYNNLYDVLYEHYLNNGEMPYSIAKARTGDPYTWVCEKLERDIR